MILFSYINKRNEVTKMKTKDLERRVLSLRARQYSLPEVMKLANADSIKQVQEILDKDKNESIAAYKNADKSSDTYSEVLIHVVRLLRNEYRMNYRDIAKALEENEYLIFDVIRRNKVTLGKNNNYIRGYFTREEKRMRNEDMLRLNREGKTFAEIGRIFYTSKQNVSQIFQDMGEKPLSEKQAISVGLDVPKGDSVEIMKLQSTVKDLKEKLNAVQKQHAMTKYHMNGIIQDLRISYIKSLARELELNSENAEASEEYKKIHHTIMRTYNSLVKTNGTETAMFKKIEDIIPMLARTNVKLKVRS